jgi:outer membrane immunogenic protein
MMIKKLGLFLVGFQFINTVHAGFYVGAGLGPDTIDFKQRAHIFQPRNFDAIDRTHLSGTGIFGTIFAGYGWFYNWFFLAPEINANFSSVSFDSSNDEFIHQNFNTTHYKIKNSYGISVLPGIQINPNSLLYARLGYENARFKIITTDISIGNASNRRDGFRYGLGLRTNLYRAFDFRMDYSRVQYDTTKLHTFDATSSTTKTTWIKPRQQLLEFGLIYNFDWQRPFFPSK